MKTEKQLDLFEDSPIRLSPALEAQLRDSIRLDKFPYEGSLSYNLTALFNEIDHLRSRLEQQVEPW